MLTSNAENPKDYALWSAFSPDGTKIAYDWFRAEEDICELHILDLNKGSSRTLLGKDAGFYREGVSWSHDQKHIATVVIGEKKKIAWISTKDGSSIILTSLEELMPGAPNDLFPSPDDRYVAYSHTSRKDPSNSDIFLVATDGSGDVIPLVEHPANDRVLGWIPGREELLFVSDRSGSWDLWMLPVKNGRPAGDPKLEYPNLGYASPLGFTDDGSFFFRVSSHWTENYFSNFDPETGKLVGSLIQLLSGENESLDWSPDGRQLAYVEVKNTTEGPGYARGSLHIRNLESGEDRKVTCGVTAVGVRWSPNGRSLLTRGYRKREVIDNQLKTGLYLVDSQTGDTSLIAERPGSRIAMGDWSADGKSIYFIDKDSIIQHDLETGRERKILTEPRPSGPLTLSPDGELLAARIIDKEKGASLITLNVSNGEVNKISSVGQIRGGLGWSADSTYLLYLEPDEKGGTNLYRVTRRGGTPEKLWHTNKNVGFLRIHPDGNQLTFSELKTESSCWVMEGLTQKH